MFHRASIQTLLACWIMCWSASAGSAAEPLSPAPDIRGQPWLNSSPPSLERLRGRVVLVEFWTYGCINCRNIEPYVKAWHERYGPRGLTVIGVHAPEFPHERDLGNVQRYLREREIEYPVVLDNDFAIWNRYGNRYWPALYLIDKQGQIRYVKVGEGAYDRTERRIQDLLAEPEPAS